MSNYFIAHERNQIFRRLEQLTPSHQAGAVTGHDTLRHLLADMQIILGPADGTRGRGLLAGGPGRWLVLNLVPWPESLPAEAERATFAPDTGRSYEEDFAAFVECLRQFDARSKASSLGAHPRFGNMNRDAWGKYMYLHIDWHLSKMNL
jgi:Protein of unknown function (DUF1569)